MTIEIYYLILSTDNCLHMKSCAVMCTPMASFNKDDPSNLEELFDTIGP